MVGTNANSSGFFSISVFPIFLRGNGPVFGCLLSNKMSLASLFAVGMAHVKFMSFV